MTGDYPVLGSYYLREDGLPYQNGDVLRNPDLAKSLTLIAEQGADVFYNGEIADAIMAEIEKYEGVMTREDLANYKVNLREPVKSTYRGYEIISCPPPSSGGTHLIQILNILENFDIGSMEVNSPSMCMCSLRLSRQRSQTAQSTWRIPISLRMYRSRV